MLQGDIAKGEQQWFRQVCLNAQSEPPLHAYTYSMEVDELADHQLDPSPPTKMAR